MVQENRLDMIRDKLVSQVLFVLAFLVELLGGSYFATLLAIVISTAGLFLFVRSLRIGKRIVGRAVPRQELFTASTCAIAFLYSNATTKVVLPAIASTDFTVSFRILVFFLIFAAGLYLVFRMVLKRTGHEKWFQDQKTTEILEDKERYERVANGMILLSVLNGLDGADLMFCLALIVAFLSEIYMFTVITVAAIRTCVTYVLRLLRGDRASIRSVFLRYFRSRKMSDFDEMFWSRAFHLARYKRGLAFMIMSFMGSLPLVFFSQSIDFLNFEPKYLMTLLVFVVPSIAAFTLIKMPKRMRRLSVKRTPVLFTSFIPPFLAILLACLRPDMMPVLDPSAQVAEQYRQGVGLAIILASMPFLLGLPLFKSIESAEEHDYDGYTRWGKIFGFSPLPLFSILICVQSIFFPTSLPSLVAFLGIALFVTVMFSLLMAHAFVIGLESWESRYHIDLTSYVVRLFKPGMNLLTAVRCFGVAFFIFVGSTILNPASVVKVTSESITASFLAAITVSFLLLHKSRSDRKFGPCLCIGILLSVSFVLSHAIFLMSFMFMDNITSLFRTNLFIVYGVVVISSFAGTTLAGIVLVARANARKIDG